LAFFDVVYNGGAVSMNIYKNVMRCVLSNKLRK